MATFNTNYELINFPVGTYDVDVLGNNLTATTVHEIYCTTSGTIIMTATGGGTATIAMTAGQSINCMIRKLVVSSGVFIGFRTKLDSRGRLYN
jgi:hypothetical protein